MSAEYTLFGKSQTKKNINTRVAVAMTSMNTLWQNELTEAFWILARLSLSSVVFFMLIS